MEAQRYGHRWKRKQWLEGSEGGEVSWLKTNLSMPSLAGVDIWRATRPIHASVSAGLGNARWERGRAAGLWEGSNADRGVATMPRQPWIAKPGG